jgi:glycosyltransferase involved in cell wall biosynthesis
MHAAVIPVISYESGVDTNDFGITLPGCSLQEVEDAVRQVSELPEARLEEMARSAWEYARRNHTREKFARDFRAVIEGILNPSPIGLGTASRSSRGGGNVERNNSRELAVSAAR